MKKNAKNKDAKRIRKVLIGDFMAAKLPVRSFLAILLVIDGLLQIAIPWVLQYTINAITVELSADIFKRAIITAIMIIMSMILIMFIKAKMQNSFMTEFRCFLKDKLFSKMMYKNVVDFKKNNSGEYLSVYQTDIEKISDMYVMGKWNVISSVAVCVLGIISMIKMSAKLSIIVLVVQVIPISITLLLGRKLPLYHEACSKKRGIFGAATQDYLKGFRLIKAFSAEKVFIDKFKSQNRNVEIATRLMFDKAIGVQLLNFVANYILIITLFFIGGLEVLNGHLKIGTIIACFELFQTISGPFSNLALQVNNVVTANGIFDRIYKLFASESDEAAGMTQKSEIDLNSITSISLNNVGFSYDEKNETLNNISFDFASGKKYAIVGDSGSGKTTLMNLMLGTYDNYNGSILMNSHELRELSSEQINREISIVQQDVFIFDDTLKANLTLGREFSQPLINSAVERAGLSDLVATHGMDYICGEDGKNLSGGEKQRISIARALLRDSGVIFFDEVTSSLDNRTTIEIEDTINSLDKTCIAITHKLNLNVLRNYDEIIVFKDGRLVESGSVDELMALNQHFYALYTFAK